MTRRPLRAILISTDQALRETVSAFARGAPDQLAVVLDYSVELSALSGQQYGSIRQSGPALVLIDLEHDAELGIKLAEELSHGDGELLPVAVGQPLDSDQLLKAMRAGMAEFLAKPVTPMSLAEALERLRPKVQAPEEEAAVRGRTLAFFSAKGGSGSSTAAINLAIELHRRTRKKTLLVDLDAELGEVALLLGVQPEFNFVDLVQNFHRMDANLLASYIEQHSSGVNVLSAPFHPDRAAGVTEEQIRQILLYLRGQYDWVVVDTSKTFSPQTLAAFEQADDVFLVATVDLPSLRNIQRALPLLRRVMPRGDQQIRLVINRYNPRDEIGLKDVERTLGVSVFATLANDYEALIKSVNAGKPLMLDTSKSAYARDIRELTGKITGTEVEDGDGGLLGRITGTWRTRSSDKGGKKRG